ncbi:hypothetical protein FRC07_014971, partial [Ceratobasidium sp. 392]
MVLMAKDKIKDSMDSVNEDKVAELQDSLDGNPNLDMEVEQGKQARLDQPDPEPEQPAEDEPEVVIAGPEQKDNYRCDLCKVVKGLRCNKALPSCG